MPKHRPNSGRRATPRPPSRPSSRTGTRREITRKPPPLPPQTLPKENATLLPGTVPQGDERRERMGLVSGHDLAKYTKRKVAEIMQRERQTLMDGQEENRPVSPASSIGSLDMDKIRAGQGKENYEESESSEEEDEEEDADQLFVMKIKPEGWGCLSCLPRKPWPRKQTSSRPKKQGGGRKRVKRTKRMVQKVHTKRVKKTRTKRKIQRTNRRTRWNNRLRI